MLAPKGKERIDIAEVPVDVESDVGDAAPGTDLLAGATPVAPGPQRKVRVVLGRSRRGAGDIRRTAFPQHDRRAGAVGNARHIVHPGGVVVVIKRQDAGLVGSGRTDLARAVFGVDPYESGQVYLFGKPISSQSASVMVEHGVSLLPEDRKKHGLALILPVAENIVVSSLDRLFPRLFVSKDKERTVAMQFVEQLRIATPSVSRLAQFLSGGNQQKVVLAKWLCTKAKIFIFDEPTRGIDVGAKAEIHGFMNELVKEGAAVLMISSELPEVIGMSDRIYVMREGRIVAEIPRAEATQERIIEYAMGADEARKTPRQAGTIRTRTSA